MRINEVLSGKGSREVLTIQPDSSVRELVSLLSEHNIGALVVSHDGSTVTGIVSERDVVRRLHQGADVLESPVSAIMSAEVRTCEGTDTVDEVMALMTAGRFRHVPVVKDGALIGIVSIGDVVKSRMGELEFERDQLDSYVHGT
jgi:CBS domain-containing protein